MIRNSQVHVFVGERIQEQTGKPQQEALWHNRRAWQWSTRHRRKPWRNRCRAGLGLIIDKSTGKSSWFAAVGESEVAVESVDEPLTMQGFFGLLWNRGQAHIYLNNSLNIQLLLFDWVIDWLTYSLFIHHFIYGFSLLWFLICNLLIIQLLKASLFAISKL